MIRDESALKLAQDILGDDAPAVTVQLAASLIVQRVKRDELEQAYAQHEQSESFQRSRITEG